MNCKDVQEQLPEYLAGILDEDSKSQIEDHIKACLACGEELKELNRDIDIKTKPANGKKINEKDIIRKTKVRFNFAIVRTVLITLFALLLILMIPTFLWGIQSALGQSKASRALMDYVQFTRPEKVNMWGNSAVEGFKLSVPLKIGARAAIGHDYREQFEFVGKMSVITGKISSPVFIGANFVHPDLFNGEDLGREKEISVQSQKLEKNADTSVATVDYSLNRTISLIELENIVEKYDVEVCWMAVEADIENLRPKNMTFSKQQVLQWGVPGKLSQPGNFDYADFKEIGADKFEKFIFDEMHWLDLNKGKLKPDAELLRNNGINNSVNEQAQYIIDNGIKIYGLRITGPSSEILKLTAELDTRTMTVVDMEFWNW